MVDTWSPTKPTQTKSGPQTLAKAAVLVKASRCFRACARCAVASWRSPRSHSKTKPAVPADKWMTEAPAVSTTPQSSSRSCWNTDRYGDAHPHCDHSQWNKGEKTANA